MSILLKPLGQAKNMSRRTFVSPNVFRPINRRTGLQKVPSINEGLLFSAFAFFHKSKYKKAGTATSIYIGKKMFCLWAKNPLILPAKILHTERWLNSKCRSIVDAEVESEH